MNEISWIEFIIMTLAVTNASYNCPTANGTARNDNDYRSYHVCTNQCDRLHYCPNPNEYFTVIQEKCQNSNLDWVPAYDLTGIQSLVPLVQPRYIQQSNYDLNWVSETKTHKFTFIGRYINETHAVGTETILSYMKKCILIQDIQLTARNTRSFCVTARRNPYSMSCSTPSNAMFYDCFQY